MEERWEHEEDEKWAIMCVTLNGKTFLQHVPWKCISSPWRKLLIRLSPNCAAIEADDPSFQLFIELFRDGENLIKVTEMKVESFIFTFPMPRLPLAGELLLVELREAVDGRL